jgi:hypothetical protein
LKKCPTIKSVVSCIPTITLEQPSKGLDNILVCRKTVLWLIFISRQGAVLAGNRLMGNNIRISSFGSGQLASKKNGYLSLLSFAVDLKLVGIS